MVQWTIDNNVRNAVRTIAYDCFISSIVRSYVIQGQGVATRYYNSHYRVAVSRYNDWEHQIPRHRLIFLRNVVNIVNVAVTYELPTTTKLSRPKDEHFC